MIAYLKGQVLHQRGQVILITHGVGYGVYVSDRVAQKLLPGQEAELFTYTHVKEEALELYGFLSTEEQSVFQLLLNVSGVGPKTALHISNHPASQIVTAVQNADTSFFTQVPRVGKKLAQKIIIDLRSKLGALKELDLQPLAPQVQEVKDALEQLGFHERDIDVVLPQLDIEKRTTAEALRTALKLLQPK